MFSHDSPTLTERMNDAKKILGDYYLSFQNLVCNYKIKSGSPYWDIACFLIYKKIYGKKTLRDKWVKFWRKSTKSSRTYNNLVYIIPISYFHFLQFQGTEGFFRTILESKVKTKREISWGDYIWILFKKRDKIKPIFTKIEFQLFKDILAIQSLSNQELKKTAWESITNLSKYKKRVLEKGVIFQGFSLNSIKLGLANYNILLSFPFSNRYDFQKYLTPNSYLNFIQIGGIGCQNVLLNYVVPDNLEVKEDLKVLKTTLENKYPHCRGKLFKLERKTKLASFNFSSYRYKLGKWDFFPQLQKLFLENYPSSERISSVPIRVEFTDFERKKLKLSRPVLKFINVLINASHTSRSQLAKKSGLTETTVKKFLKYLSEERIIKDRVNPMVVFGLASIVLFLDYPKDKQYFLHQLLSVFVETYTETYQAKNEKGIITVVRCPQETVLSATEILRKIFNDKIKELFIIDQFYSKRFQFPVERYNPLYQQWVYEKRDLFGELHYG
ncbi:MAG: hypothetical protein ACTSP3_01280 [Candidatus Heimdallarchaeaceae archaeon]